MDNSPNFNNAELPKPLEKGSIEQGPRNTSDLSPELSGPSPLEMIAQAQGAVVQAVQPAQQTADPVALPVIPLGQHTQPADDSSNPLVAEDNDVLEKEWVEKAKQIVTETRNDPREQTNKFVNMRYDYVKKRYGKEIVVSNENHS